MDTDELRQPDLSSELALILDVSIMAGQIVAENGANTAVVESAVRRIGKALGAEQVEVNFNSTAIIATVRSGSEHRTCIQQVGQPVTQLSRLGQVLELESQAEAGHLDSSEIKRRLTEIRQSGSRYGLATNAVAVGLGCGASAIKFGGAAGDFALVFVVSFLALILRHSLLRFRMGMFMGTVLVAAFATALANGLTWTFGGESNPGVTIGAAVLLLSPGGVLLSGAADLLRGDVVSGLGRVTGAFVRLFAVALGVWAMSLTFGLGVQTLTFPGQHHPLLLTLMGGLGSIAFGVLFGVAPRYLGALATVGAGARLVESLCLAKGVPQYASALLAGFSVGLGAHMWSRLLKAPYQTFAVPGYVPLIPGAVFIHGVLSVVAGNNTAGLTSLIGAQFTLLAVVVGLVSVPTLFDIHEKGMA